MPAQVRFSEIEDLLRLLIGDKPESEFHEGLAGQDRLGAFTLVAAADAIDLGRWTRSHAFDRGISRLAEERFDTGEGADVFVGDGEGRGGFPLPVGQGAHGVVESLDGDAAFGIMQAGHQPGGGGGGIHDGSAEDSGVEIVGGAGHLELQRGDSPQCVGEGRIGVRGHAGVRNHDDVAGQIFLMLFEERFKVSTADLFLSFDEEDDVHGQFLAAGQQFSQTEDMRQNLAFVVGRTPGEDPSLPNDRFEGRSFPQFQRLGRLHVIVAVDEHSGLGRVLRCAGDHGGMAAGFPDLGCQSQRGELGFQPFGTGDEIHGMLGLRGNARKTEEFE